ncbi:hypothetical protein J5J10_20585 [Ciceribacter sp. L1K23]|uniref:hypothetical protein n=1 Tax=Ciceribacter sp. L1K23 TaxID=2820276 RepID=UPI001B82FEF0|nr:hypothetical protein [Ciceribacter sp. L1K23]MBR0558096.1 hypothetical protein [Ciceribacter sp. L1K23]
MARFQLPLSGDVTQTINPWTWVFSPAASQFGLLNLKIDLGPSADPDIEAEVVRDVASYGRQIGQISDAMAVLIEQLDRQSLTPEQHKAIVAFELLRDEVENVKARHKVTPAPEAARDMRAVTA